MHGRVVTNLEDMENLENSGNLKNCQNFKKNLKKKDKKKHLKKFSKFRGQLREILYFCGKPAWQGAHKPGKHGKPGKLREFEKFQGKLREILYFCGKTWKPQGKCKTFDIILNENVFQRTFLSRVSQGKV